MATNYSKDSFLKRAKTREGTFLDVNDLTKIRRSVNDEIYTIPAEFDERPDLLANFAYDNSRLWWVFSIRNPDVLKDPIRDFKAGTTIVLPAANSVRNTVAGK